MDFDLLCLGCGPAGERAATQAAMLGHRVAVIERATRPGGAMVNTGTLPSKALRQTAVFLSTQRRMAGPWRLALRRTAGAADRVDVSISQFMARCHEVQALEHDRIESAFDAHQVQIIHGSGRILDPHTVEVVDETSNVRRLTSRFLLIATGSTPVSPAASGLQHPCVCDADGILALGSLPESLVIIGGGVIGCEYASVFAELGCRVTLIEPRDVILPFLDEDIRAALLGSMESIGIRLLTRTSVTGLAPQSTPSQAVLMLSDGTALAAPCVLYALGRRGNTADIGLHNVGLQPDSRGQLAVNTHFQTAVPSIYAAGDVVGFPALASASMEQGILAASHMFGLPRENRLADALPVGIYTVPAIASVGLNLRDARAKNIDAHAVRVRFSENARGRILGLPHDDSGGLLKLVYDSPTGRILGAQIFGQDAVELIHIAQHAILAGKVHPDLGTVHHMAQCVFNYPSLAETFRIAAGRAAAFLAGHSSTAHPRRSAA